MIEGANVDSLNQLKLIYEKERKSEHAYSMWEAHMLTELNDAKMTNCILEDIRTWRQQQAEKLSLSFISKQSDLLIHMDDGEHTHLLNDHAFQSILLNMMLYKFKLPFVINITSDGVLELKPT